MKATHIVVVQSGWIFVGTKPTTMPLDIVKLTDAACVRRWGTTKGLGELALSGPLKDTVLDPCGTVEIASATVLFSIPVAAAQWKS